MKSLAVILFALVGLVACEKWSVYDENAHEYCIILEAETTLNLVYSTENGTETCKVEVKDVDSVTGNCKATHDGKPAQILTIGFTPLKNDSHQPWSLDIIFTTNANGYKVSEYKVLTAENPICPQAITGQIQMLKNSTNDVAASGSSGFKCSKSALPLESGSSVEFKGLRTVAFSHLTTAEFPANQGFDLCFLDTRTSDIVPIIVGACLACLVIVVLVAYLIGRARARRQGYASV
ncbi:unnamed protein product [Auanema sp. JU1783]|nr:unnamed protein product [Auanema sp. JU1783]